MAQTGYTPILIYASGTAGNTPSASNLTSSASGAELALNYFDGKLFYKDNSGVVQVLAGKGGSGVVAGSNTQVQYNNNGVFGASANMVFNGTRLTVADFADSSLTSGRVTYATTGGNLTDSANLTFDGTTLAVTGPVSSTRTGSENYLLTDSASATRSSLQQAGNALYFNVNDNTATSGAFIWRNTNSVSELMRLTSTGLGIGTSSPSVRLQLEQAANSAPVTLLRLNNSGTTGGGPGIASRISFTAGATALGYIQGSNFASGAGGLQLSGDGTNAQATLDSSGNLGLGVTPSAWEPTMRAFQVANVGAHIAAGMNNFSGAQQLFIGNNSHFNSSGQYIYARTNPAALYRQLDNSHLWLVAPSGTAGNAITFTQAMTLNANSTLSLVSPVNTTQAQITLADTDGRTLAIRSPNSGAPNIAQIGTTTNHDLAFLTGNTERARIDTSGNLGLGVTPSAWGANGKPLQTGNASFWGLVGTATFSSVGANYFYDGAYKYISNGVASDYYQLSGAHVWRTAGSGTAGAAISFTQAMTLDSSGNLLVGTTTTAYATSGRGLFEVNGSSSSLMALKSGDTARGYFAASSTSTEVAAVGASQPLLLTTNGAERARITSGGNLLVGTTVDIQQLSMKRNTSIGWVNGAGNGSDQIIYADSSSNLQFYTQATERARITSSGNLLVGTVNPAYASGERFSISPAAGANGVGIAIGNTNNIGIGIYNGYTATGTATAIQFQDHNSVVRGSITVTTSATAYVTSSDYRLKEDVQPMTGALAKVAALKPCTYKWKQDGSAGEGFIAHELAEVCPAAVTGEKDAVNEDGSIKPQGIDTSFLVATLAAAIQELKAEFDAYKATHP